MSTYDGNPVNLFGHRETDSVKRIVPSNACKSDTRAANEGQDLDTEWDEPENE